MSGLSRGLRRGSRPEPPSPRRSRPPVTGAPALVAGRSGEGPRQSRCPPEQPSLPSRKFPRPLPSSLPRGKLGAPGRGFLLIFISRSLSGAVRIKHNGWLLRVCLSLPVACFPSSLYFSFFFFSLLFFPIFSFL